MNRLQKKLLKWFEENHELQHIFADSIYLRNTDDKNSSEALIVVKPISRLYLPPELDEEPEVLYHVDKHPGSKNKYYQLFLIIKEKHLEDFTFIEIDEESFKLTMNTGLYKKTEK